MRNHLRLRVLLPALASLAAACGGGTADPTPGSSTSSSGSSGTSGGSSGSSGTSGGSSGSSGSSGTSSGTIETFQGTVCDPSYEPMKGLTLNGIESLEIRVQIDNSGSPPQIIPNSPVAGTECATATNMIKCTGDVHDLRSDAGWNSSAAGGQQTHSYAVTTKGDTIAVVSDQTKLGPLVAPVENPKDAAFLVTAGPGGNYVACDQGNNWTQTATGYDVLVHAGTACGAGAKELARVYSVTTDGTVALKSETVFKLGDPNCAIGRRPEGLLAHESAPCADPIGGFFAEAAHLEAASVFSFERLARELLELGAPDELLAAASAAREDEIRHARMTAKLARRFGGSTSAPLVAALPARDRLAIALENATEGCVRETYGALVAHRQAAHATDPSIRCMMHVIAADETMHAGLAWDVAAWLEPQLTADERVLVEDARRRAIADLRRELAAHIHPDLETRAGMPNAETAIRLLDSLDRSFLAAA